MPLSWLTVPLQSANYATQAILPNTPTYANGTSGLGATITAGSNSTLTVDGVVQAVGARILVNQQVNSANNMGYNANGVYVVTTAGSGGSEWVLTRVVEAAVSSPTSMCPGTLISVLSGTSANDTYIMDNQAFTTFATTTGVTSNITFDLFTQQSQLPTSKGDFLADEIDFVEALYQRKMYDITAKIMSLCHELSFFVPDVNVFANVAGDQTPPQGSYPSDWNQSW